MLVRCVLRGSIVWLKQRCCSSSWAEKCWSEAPSALLRGISILHALPAIERFADTVYGSVLIVLWYIYVTALENTSWYWRSSFQLTIRDNAPSAYVLNSLSVPLNNFCLVALLRAWILRKYRALSADWVSLRSISMQACRSSKRKKEKEKTCTRIDERANLHIFRPSDLALWITCREYSWFR